MLALRARDGAALSGWDLPRAPADALLFEGQASRGGGAASAAASDGGSCRLCPPLLVLTSDRELAVLEVGSAAGPCAASAASPRLGSKRARRGAAAALLGEPPSAFEAKFGGADPAARPGPATPERGHGGLKAGSGCAGGAAAAAAPWAALFDAPSHALPAPGALASRFLDTLLLPPQR